MASAKVRWNKRREVCRQYCQGYRSVNSLIAYIIAGLSSYPLFLHSDYIDQHKVAIVCSARSGSTKALGTTNLLLKAASEALPRANKKSRPTSDIVTPIANGLSRGMSFSDPSSITSSPRTRSSSSPRSASPAPFFSLTPLTVPQAGQPSPEFNATVDTIRLEHLNAAKASIRDPRILEELEAEIERDCDWLRSFLFAAQVGFLFFSFIWQKYIQTKAL